ncbi:unnamed protein product [marine sediment metagenome]|uniref:Phage ABA sandwich domain-containing protein n=1 Tax=marine sediment metagenome TaxID=412755 RepID=X0RTG9_9ZZZZ
MPDVDTLPAGPELNVLVARWVKGWFVSDSIPNHYRLPLYVGSRVTHKSEPFEWHDWQPSTDIAAAWEVVDELNRRGWWVKFNHCLSNGIPAYQAEFTHKPDKYKGLCVYAVGDTAPLAICRAALKAVQAKGGEDG